MTEIIDLMKKRNSAKSQLAKLLTVVNKHTKGVTVIDQLTIPIYMKRLETLSKQIDTIQSDIIVLCTTEKEAEEQDDILADLQDKVVNLQTTLLRMVQLKNDIKGSGSSTNNLSSSIVKLPTIQLPTFEGKSFQDLFLASVNKNSVLSNAQKLQYLRSTVTGEAARLIKSFQVTDQNYGEAWKILQDRYDNKREIVSSILKRFFSQQGLTKESASDLQTLLDTTTECIRALKVLERPVDNWDDVLIYTIVEKMDLKARRQWALSLQSTDCPTFKDLSTFIEKHVRGLLACTKNQESVITSGGERRQAASSSHHIATANKCLACQSNHHIFFCSKFKSLSSADKIRLVKKYSLCYNRLKSGHVINQCKNTSSCKKCNKKHNTLLHFDKLSPEKPSSQQQQEAHLNGHSSSNERKGTQVLLSTALINIIDLTGTKTLCRAFLDNGSQSSFITERCVQRLRLARKKVNVEVTGLGSSVLGTCHGSVILQISSLVQNANVEVNALIMKNVAGTLPTFKCKQGEWAHIERLKLADPHYYEPGQVDILLRADVYSSVMRDGRKEGQIDSPIAQNSMFGWILSGRVKKDDHQLTTVHHACCDIENMVKKIGNWRKFRKLSILLKRSSDVRITSTRHIREIKMEDLSFNCRSTRTLAVLDHHESK